MATKPDILLTPGQARREQFPPRPWRPCQAHLAPRGARQRPLLITVETPWGTPQNQAETKQGVSEVINCGQREAVHQVASGDRKSAGDTPRQGNCARVALSLPATPQDPGGQDTASACSGQPPRLPSSSHAHVTPHTRSNFPQATAEMDLVVGGRSDITQKF